MSAPLRRDDFPSLRRTLNGLPLAYLDGPAGSQVPRQVLEAMERYYTTMNANTHGAFVTSVESDAMLEEARTTVAGFLGSGSGATISFGANMTTLTFALSRALGRLFRPGDEVVITELDHEANRGPWLSLVERGVVIREIALRPDGTLDADDMRAKIGPRTRLVAMGLASNALGTVNDVALARDLSAKAGAWLLLDAVHYAPHFSVDVRALDPDFLLCSSYKFYGPHVGILYCREGLLDTLPADRLRTQTQRAPYLIETGTLNHAAIAGVKAAVEYIASLGKGTELRSRLVDAMGRIGTHERKLAEKLHHGLTSMRGVTVHGPPFSGQRAPTVSFTTGRLTAGEVCGALAEAGICGWDGHFYAIRAIEKLGLLERGGVTRLGILLYNTEEEVDRLLRRVGEIVG
jgi:cysteine desulfurase family protein (TIGR01976 family)